jgi:hypothetical protein
MAEPEKTFQEQVAVEPEPNQKKRSTLREQNSRAQKRYRERQKAQAIKLQVRPFMA